MLDYKNEFPAKHGEHIFPMSNHFFIFDIDILLSLESFPNNWEQIIVPTYGFVPKSFNKGAGFHKSSIFHPNAKKDTKSHIFRSLFRTIHKQDPKLWQALCRFILIDYVCLPQYELPVGCEHLLSDVIKGRALLS